MEKRRVIKDLSWSVPYDAAVKFLRVSEDDEEEHIRNIVESGNETAVAVKRNDIIISIEEANAARNNELLTSLVGNLEFLTGIIDKYTQP